jgi:hypothetical protein
MTCPSTISHSPHFKQQICHDEHRSSNQLCDHPGVPQAEGNGIDCLIPSPSTSNPTIFGEIDFEEFVAFAKNPKNMQSTDSTKKPSTLIIIGRVKAGVNMKSIKLGKLLEKIGGGGHATTASATVHLNDELEAAGILSGLIDELIETSLQEQFNQRLVIS